MGLVTFTWYIKTSIMYKRCFPSAIDSIAYDTLIQLAQPNGHRARIPRVNVHRTHYRTCQKFVPQETLSHTNHIYRDLMIKFRKRGGKMA